MRVLAIEERSLRVGGLVLHHYDWGRPASPPVLLLHGMMGNAREWDTVVRSLGDRFRVVALDQRGHGRSDWAPSYDARALAADALAVIEVLGLAPVALVGHSMGGMAALIAASERPDVVARLAMLDVGPDSVRAEVASYLQPLLAGLAAASYRDVDEAVAAWIADDPYSRPELVRHWASHNLVGGPDGRLRWRFDAEGLSSFVSDGVSEEQLWRAVEALAVPTLLVRGEHSPLLSRATAEDVVALVERSSLVEIPAAAHDLGVQQPEAVARAVLAFLTEP